jgi:hypothetical protein
MSDTPVYIDSLTRLKQEREVRKAKKKVRKEIEQKVGKKQAKYFVKKAYNKVMQNADTVKKIEKHAARGG